MSKYTSEVRYICESVAGFTESVGYSGIDEVLNKAIPKIFDFDFPIFNESYRNPLLKKILKHYYTREISEESYGLWKLRLDSKLNELMPYYNKLYESELLKFDPLITYSMETLKDTTDTININTREDTTNTTDGTSKTKTKTNVDITDTKTFNNLTDTTIYGSEDKTTNDYDVETNLTKGTKSKDVYSDTPQGAISNLENNTYLTNARIVEDSGTDKTVTTNDGTITVNKTGQDTLTKDGSVTDTRIGDEKNNHTTTKTTDNKTLTIDSKNITEQSNIENLVEKVVGYSGQSASELILKLRKTFLNIDMELINDLEPLFFQLW